MFFLRATSEAYRTLVKQYRQAALATIPFLSAFTTDATTLPAQQDAAVDFLSGTHWAPNMGTPESRAFVKAFEEAYKSVPGSYAMHGYDTALLIDAAVKAAGGKVSDQDALRAQLRKADYKSLRGKMRFGANQFPVQDFYLAKVAKRPDGKFETQIVDTIFKDYVDVYAAECQRK